MRCGASAGVWMRDEGCSTQNAANVALQGVDGQARPGALNPQLSNQQTEKTAADAAEWKTSFYLGLDARRVNPRPSMGSLPTSHS